MLGCGEVVEVEDAGVIEVVTTAGMVTELVERIGGEQVRVTGLMGPRVDPHSFEPVLSDTRLLRGAEVVFYVGLNFEGRMVKSLERLERRGRGGQLEVKAVAVSDGIEREQLQRFGATGQGGEYDPHVWGDPRLWAKCAEKVAAELGRLRPQYGEEFAQRARALGDEFEALHEWGMNRVNDLPEGQRVLVTSHDAFRYFGGAFGLEVRGVQGVSTEAEIGLRERANVVEFMRERGVRVVFAETSVNPRGLQSVAREAKVRVSDYRLFSDSMAERGKMERWRGEDYDLGTYEGMLKHNINVIVDEIGKEGMVGLVSRGDSGRNGGR